MPHAASTFQTGPVGQLDVRGEHCLALPSGRHYHCGPCLPATAAPNGSRSSSGTCSGLTGMRPTRIAAVLVIVVLLGFSFNARCQPSSTATGAPADGRQFFILLDQSGTMKGARLRALQRALLERFLPDLEMGTQLHIFTFDAGIQRATTIVLKGPDDVRAVQRFVETVAAVGARTYAWSSLEHVLTEAAKARKAAPRSPIEVVMYTDGLDNQTNGPGLEAVLRRFDALKREAGDEVGLKVFTLGFRLADGEIASLKSHGATVADVPDLSPIPIPSAAEFGWWPTEPVAGTAVKFINRSIPRIGQAAGVWTFGDGANAQGSEPEHVFGRPGSFQVTLVVDGNRRTRSVEVHRSPPPIAQLEVRTPPDEIRSGSAVVFQDVSQGVVTGWSWTFGDGEAATTRNPTHIYRKTGTYEVILKVVGPGGESSARRTVEVNRGATIAFDVRPRAGRAPLQVQILNQSTEDVGSMTWDFGDGARSTERQPLPHRYSRQGDYVVTLMGTATRDGVALAPVTVAIRVGPPFPWGTVIACAVAAFGLVLVVVYLRRPPRASVGQRYALDELGKRHGGIVTVGAGWRATDRKRHVIPLPPEPGMLPGFTTFEQSPTAGTGAIWPADGPTRTAELGVEPSRVSVPEGLAELPRGDAGRLLVTSGQCVEIDGYPYHAEADAAGSLVLRPGWRVVPSEATAGLTVQRESRVIEVGRAGTTLVQGDRVICGPFTFRYVRDPGAHLILNAVSPAVGELMADEPHQDDEAIT